jgi:hypothetical protein
MRSKSSSRNTAGTFPYLFSYQFSSTSTLLTIALSNCFLTQYNIIRTYNFLQIFLYVCLDLPKLNKNLQYSVTH